MPSSIRKFWSALDGPVHPSDAPVFRENTDHTFDLRFPPPAFTGDIDEAPIVILMANGGYKEGATAADFPNDAAISGYINYLRGEATGLPSAISSYYTGKAVGSLIADGTVAMVNAVAYRSPRLSAEPKNVALARRLPSVEAHRRWLHREILPAAFCRRRYLFVHRKSLWGIDKHLPISPNIKFSDPLRAEPNRPFPDKERIADAQAWLASFRMINANHDGLLPTIENEFEKSFAEWNITLPKEDVIRRQPGTLNVEGWSIDYKFGLDADGIFLHYVAGHRMLHGEHDVRIYELRG